MAHPDINQGRRRLLITATSVVGAAGVAAVAAPFLNSWNPSARALAAGAPIEVDISKVEPGQLLRAVSYTHLDVYKRQTKSRPLCLSAFPGIPLITSTEKCLRQSLPHSGLYMRLMMKACDKIRAGIADSHASVSYTHLDVYKRQAGYGGV